MSKVSDNNFMYVVDGSYDASEIGSQENISDYDDRLKKAMNNGNGDYSNFEYTEKYGYMITAVTPILSSTGKVVGLLCCDFSGNDILKDQKSYIMKEIITNILVMILGSIVIIFIVGKMLKYISTLTSNLDMMSKFDLTCKVDKTNTKDEIEIISNGIEKVRVELTNLINNVIKNTGNVDNQLNESVDNLGQVDGKISNLSATVQQLSAGMEETAASAEEMSATSQQIERSVNDIAQKSREGAMQAGEINKRAEKTKKDIQDAQINSHKVYINAKKELECAIKSSKVVNKINVLSESIKIGRAHV